MRYSVGHKTTMRKACLYGFVVMLCVGLIFSSVRVYGSASFSDVAGHWVQETIEWGTARQIITGYDDGTFKPNRFVTEAEFLVMLLNAYPEYKLPHKTNDKWYESYYEFATTQHWPTLGKKAGDTSAFNRGQVARLIVSTQGQSLSIDDAIQYLLDRRLASGKTSATVAGFAADDRLTRAEALQFIRNLKQSDVTLKPVSKHAVGEFQVNGVSVGDSLQQMLSELGEPARKDASEYGFTWYIYNQDYSNYAQIGVRHAKVVAIYSNADNWSSQKGISIGSTPSNVKAAYGSPLDYLEKGNTHFLVNGNRDEYEYFLIDNLYATLFYDIHDQQQVTAVLLIEKKIEDALPAYYGTSSSELAKSYELQIWDMANAIRTRMDKAPLMWDDTAAVSARKHSEDMAVNQFFDHDNLKGESPFDRMEKEGIRFRVASENIATGQRNAIFAHEGWMNSYGHRVNVLGETTRLGVGIHFGGDYHVYYTQNFYTPTR